MARILYDLCGADQRLRFSPFCWRTHMALKHKGLDYEARPWLFTDKDEIAFSVEGDGSKATVPVLVDDDDRVVTDSFEILRYLDHAYPGMTLLAHDQAESRARFIKYWSETQVAPAIFRAIILDIFHNLDERDQPYFRETREKRFGTTLEEFRNVDQGLEMLDRALTPLRSHLQDLPFLDGQTAGGADYIAFGIFMTAHVMRAEPLLAEDDVVMQWQNRLLDEFQGFARNATTVRDLASN
ncbi:glutathione S-transferase N-terminal domain-containing protein [Kushneria phosphatilytica]|uniref:Glutathione S-transferase family protein n=1 Tax=Kushneria phosphatilytica TaxID=657387 RepID=A0A1S1NZL5_9GAMM|nr:glutathione S-transferase N-terminal domain-containing protein [Kushneria phosphatilytica]OHV13801.1 glutathione S-transferase [Kushneria phosphatilytica]QEL10352.1 glutathione S-transferase family protein [Kushneria phosphatilytica]